MAPCSESNPAPPPRPQSRCCPGHLSSSKSPPRICPHPRDVFARHHCLLISHRCFSTGPWCRASRQLPSTLPRGGEPGSHHRDTRVAISPGTTTACSCTTSRARSSLHRPLQARRSRRASCRAPMPRTRNAPRQTICGLTPCATLTWWPRMRARKVWGKPRPEHLLRYVLRPQRGSTGPGLAQPHDPCRAPAGTSGFPGMLRNLRKRPCLLLLRRGPLARGSRCWAGRSCLCGRWVRAWHCMPSRGPWCWR